MSFIEKLIFAVLGVLFGGMLIFCLSLLAEAATLSISGSATGQGYHEMVVLPDIENLTVEEAAYLLGSGYGYNVTRYVLVTFENGTAWNLSIEGMT